MNERFSLLLLEPGEIFFDDYSVYYYPVTTPEHTALAKRQRGFLKLCSYSVIFEPQDHRLPLTKFIYKDCITFKEWSGPLFSKIDKNDALSIDVNQYVELLEDDVIAPYKFIQIKKTFVFALDFVKANVCISKMFQLQRASSLPLADRNSMIHTVALARQQMVQFNPCWLDDLFEVIQLTIEVNKISPVVSNPGRLVLTNCRVYFQPYNNAEDHPVLKLKLSAVQRLAKKRYSLRHVGLEIYLDNDLHCFFAFSTPDQRELFYTTLLHQPKLNLVSTNQESMVLQWQNGVISNYEYLMYLNSVADRTFNDLAQYPVFPWVLSDYTSSHLDLSDPGVYRDLSKPVGALNHTRLARLKGRFGEMVENAFLYGSHYSTPGFVAFYLVRKMPEYMLCLENGRFDNPDRMFNSIAVAWRNVNENGTDFKELIPEFYDTETGGDFLVNSKNINFGSKQDGQAIGDVVLPPWAKDSSDFVRKMREALESDYVSANLHLWLDLIFGYKQRGEEAVKADNVFFYLTYEGAVDLDSIEDLNEREGMRVQIREFGQVPRQIFQTPHPVKRRTLALAADDGGHAQAAVTHEQRTDERSLHIREESATQWTNMESVKKTLELKMHKEAVNSICFLEGSKRFLSVGSDCALRTYSANENGMQTNTAISNLPLSSCAVLSNRPIVIMSCWDNCLYVYNIESGRRICIVQAHDDAINGLRCNGNMLVTGSTDCTAKVWDWHSCDDSSFEAHLKAELDHDSSVFCLDLNRDNSVLVTGTDECQVTFWNLELMDPIHKIKMLENGSINAVQFNPDGRKVVCCGKNLTVLDVQTGTKLFLKDIGEIFSALAWDGCTCLVGSESGFLYVWDLVNGQMIDRKYGHDGCLKCIVVSANGNYVATGGEDKKTVLWEKTGAEPLSKIQGI